MSRTVTAIYSSREEAEHARRALTSEVSLAHAEVYDRSPESADALQRIEATDDERAHFSRQLEGGEYMLLAQVRGGEDPDHIITILQRIAQEPQGGDDFLPQERADFSHGGGQDADMDLPQHDDASFGASGDVMGGAHSGAGDVTEERIPVVEEELRVGTREVVRGGARVHTRVEEVPVQKEVELVDEDIRVDRRPVMRTVSEAELEAGGLLRERVIEVAQIREEPLVTREAFVREEVVVTKTLERRVERIEETVRRTEVEVDDLSVAPGSQGYGGPGGPTTDTPR